MIEILPIKLLTEEDIPFYGSLNVLLGTLSRANFSVGHGIVITPPYLKLKTTLEHYKLDSKEFIEQVLTLVKKEIDATPIPQILITETKKEKHFFVKGQLIKSVKALWLVLLNNWLEQIKSRVWNKGFYPGATENLDAQSVIFVKKVKSFGIAFFDFLQDDVVVTAKSGNLKPDDLKKVTDLVKLANKKLCIPREYEWIMDGQIKLTKVLPYTPLPIFHSEYLSSKGLVREASKKDFVKRSAVKVLCDISSAAAPSSNGIDGLFLVSEKIFDLGKLRESFENLILRIMESAGNFPYSPILFKLADKSEGMGKIRGTLRLLHQNSLFNPLVEVLDFARHKKGLNNIHIVVPFLRSVKEFLQIKKELAVKKLARKPSLQIWMEIAVPENILNLEQYLSAGLDGVVLNLDELIAYLNGFDTAEENLSFYKNEVEGLIKFISNALTLLHQAKIPFITYGSLAFNPKMLEFLVEKGVYGIVAENYEAHSAHDLFYQTEKRVILKKFQPK